EGAHAVAQGSQVGGELEVHEGYLDEFATRERPPSPTYGNRRAASLHGRAPAAEMVGVRCNDTMKPLPFWQHMGAVESFRRAGGVSPLLAQTGGSRPPLAKSP